MSSYDFEKPKNGRSYVYETEELAGLGERLIALIIDGVILGIIGGVLFSGLREGTLSSIITFLIAFIVYGGHRIILGSYIKMHHIDQRIYKIQTFSKHLGLDLAEQSLNAYFTRLDLYKTGTQYAE